MRLDLRRSWCRPPHPRSAERPPGCGLLGVSFHQGKTRIRKMPKLKRTVIRLRQTSFFFCLSRLLEKMNVAWPQERKLVLPSERLMNLFDAFADACERFGKPVQSIRGAVASWLETVPCRLIWLGEGGFNST